jgi:hypothetical protein
MNAFTSAFSFRRGAFDSAFGLSAGFDPLSLSPAMWLSDTGSVTI